MDGELTSEIPFLHNPCHYLSGKQRSDTHLVPFGLSYLSGSRSHYKGADPGQLRNMFLLEQKSASMLIKFYADIIWPWHLSSRLF